MVADSRATGRELLDYLGTYFQLMVHSRPALLLSHSFSPRGYPFRTKPRSRHSIPPPIIPPAAEPWVGEVRWAGMLAPGMPGSTEGRPGLDNTKWTTSSLCF